MHKTRPGPKVYLLESEVGAGKLIMPHDPIALKIDWGIVGFEDAFPRGESRTIQLTLKWIAGGKEKGLLIDPALKIHRSQEKGSYTIPYVIPAPWVVPALPVRVGLRIARLFRRRRRREARR